MIINHICWFPYQQRPVYTEGGDNRILSCSILPDGVLNVCYLILLPDGRTVNSKDYLIHNEKWMKKNALKWESLKCDYWTYIKDITPF